MPARTSAIDPARRRRDPLRTLGLEIPMNGIVKHLIWGIVALIGASCLGVIALRQGEQISALWIVVAAMSIYLVAYRYYSLYIAKNVMQLDPTRATPAHINNDGLDYVPTNKHVLFGHHFAAIAGAGPLVGPVLAAQMGYLPGLLWLIVGVVLAGAVQDFMVLFISSRRNGRSLGDLVREEMGPVAGTIALFGAFMIMIIILAVLAMIVVKALAESPWGMFTVIATMPIAIFMGVYMRYIRPGKIGEISVVGIILLLAAIWFGGKVGAHPTWGPAFTFTGTQITWMLIGYGFVAAVLPVWLLLAPRDYLSTFLKIGVIVALAIGIFIASPEVTTLKMPALTEFAATGDGPVWKGGLFPFLFITIACGAVSGFHALISSGTTPKLLANETHARYIGYGGMLMESFVAIMALVAASILDPGIYFAMNSPAAIRKIITPNWKPFRSCSRKSCKESSLSRETFSPALTVRRGEASRALELALLGVDVGQVGHDLGLGLVEHRAVRLLLGDELVPVLDRVLVRPVLELAAHGREVGLAHRGAEGVGLAHVAVHGLEARGDRQRRVVAEGGVKARLLARLLHVLFGEGG